MTEVAIVAPALASLEVMAPVDYSANRNIRYIENQIYKIKVDNDRTQDIGRYPPQSFSW